MQQKLRLPTAPRHRGKVTTRLTKSDIHLSFLHNSWDIKLPAEDCFMIAAAMTNHRHVGGPSLAAQPYGGVAPFSVLMPAAATTASLAWRETEPIVDGAFGRYRIRLAKDGSDRLAACRLRLKVFNVGMGEGLSSPHSTGLRA